MSRQVNDSLITVHQAAERLDVSPRRIQSLLQKGDLPGFKVGGQWFVSRLSVRQRSSSRRTSGRPFSPRSAWVSLALLCRSQGDEPLRIPEAGDWLIYTLRSRLRHEGFASLAPHLDRRAALHRFWVQPSQLPRLAAEDRLVLSGFSVAHQYGLDILAPEEIEAYVPAENLPRLAERYSLADFVRKPNVAIHAVSFWPFAPDVKDAPLPVAILDLLESENERTRSAGRDALLHYEAKRPGIEGLASAITHVAGKEVL